MALATIKEVEKHSALVSKAQHLRIAIEKADVRTGDGRKEFRETWRQVASPAYMYGPAIPLWSLATLLKTIAPSGHKMNSVVDKMVEDRPLQTPTTLGTHVCLGQHETCTPKT
jgi:hypothetical protein